MPLQSTTETERLTALKELELLDTAGEQVFDELTALAALICEAPICLITLLDEKRQWFKSKVGIEICETPRELAFCEHALNSPDLLVVPDALLDARFASNPLVKGEPFIRFYAGAPLQLSSGPILGTLCVVDRRPRKLSELQIASLKSLARQIVSLIELRKKAAELARVVLERDESQESYELIIEGINDAAWRWNLITNHVEFSPRWKSMLGYEEDDLVDSFETWKNLCHPDDWPRAKAVLEGYLATGLGHYELEHRLRRKDGSYCWILTRGTALRDENGKPFKLAGSHTDISRRKEAEQKLLQTQAAMDNAVEGMAVLNESQEFIYLNLAHARLFGYSEPSQLLGRNWGILFGASEKSRMENDIMPFINLNGHWKGEAIALRRDGTEFEAGLSLTVVKDVGLICICRDIVEIKEKERQLSKLNAELERRVLERTAALDGAAALLRRSEERYKLAVRGTSDGIWDWNVLTGDDYFSERFSELLGYEPLELLPHVDTWVGLLHPDDKKIVLEAVNNHLERRMPYDVEMRMRTKQGAYRWFRARAQAVWNEAGVATRMSGTILDVTSRKEAEAEMLKYQGQLRAISSQLLQSEEAERRRIALNIHDNVGQTLAACRIKLGEMGSILPEGASKEAAKEVRRLLEQAIQETRTLTFDLSPPVLHELGLIPALGWLAEIHTRPNGIKVTCKSSMQLELAGDVSVLLFRITRELLLNALKHAEARNIDILVEKIDHQLRIEVRDDGIGFEPEGDIKKSGDSGGFGLFSIRDRLRFVGGRLDLESAAGVGTRAVVVVPVEPATTVAK